MDPYDSGSFITLFNAWCESMGVSEDTENIDELKEKFYSMMYVNMGCDMNKPITISYDSRGRRIFTYTTISNKKYSVQVGAGCIIGYNKGTEDTRVLFGMTLDAKINEFVGNIGNALEKLADSEVIDANYFFENKIVNSVKVNKTARDNIRSNRDFFFASVKQRFGITPYTKFTPYKLGGNRTDLFAYKDENGNKRIIQIFSDESWGVYINEATVSGNKKGDTFMMNGESYKDFKNSGKNTVSIEYNLNQNNIIIDTDINNSEQQHSINLGNTSQDEKKHFYNNYIQSNTMANDLYEKGGYNNLLFWNNNQSLNNLSNNNKFKNFNQVAPSFNYINNAFNGNWINYNNMNNSYNNNYQQNYNYNNNLHNNFSNFYNQWNYNMNIYRFNNVQDYFRWNNIQNINYNPDYNSIIARSNNYNNCMNQANNLEYRFNNYSLNNSYNKYMNTVNNFDNNNNLNKSFSYFK